VETPVQRRFSRVQTVVLCTLIVTFILAEIATFFLTKGFLVIISQVFYFPIIILSFKYPRHAVPLSLGVSCFYLVISFGSVGAFGSPDMLTPFMQFYVYVSLSVVLSSLFSDFRVSETKHLELFRHSENGICLVNLVAGTVSEMNPRCHEILGVADIKEGKTRIIDVFPEPLVSFIREPVDESADSTAREINLKNPDGTRRDILVSRTRIDDVDLTAITIVDITKRKHAEQEIAAQAARLAIINRIISLSETTKNADALIRETVETILETLRFESGGLYLIDYSDHTARLEYGKNTPYSPGVDVRKLPIDTPPFSAICKNEAQFIDDLSGRDLPGLFTGGLVSVASVPVTSGGTVIGAITVGSVNRHIFTGDEQSLLRAIGQQLGTALEKRRAEERIRREEENLHTLFDTIDDLVLVLDADGKIVGINKAVERKLGYARADLIGQSIQMLREPDRKDRIADVIGDLMSCGMDTCPLTFFTKSGIAIEVECQVRRGIWNGEPVFFGISRDITERRQAEEMLRNRTAILEAVSYAADRFLKEPLHGSTWSEEIPSVIEILGKATGAGRVCLFQNRVPPGKTPPEVRVSMAFEWTAPGFYPRIDRLNVQDISYKELFPEVYGKLSRGEPAFLSVSDLPFISDEYAQKNQNLSLINIPIMAESHWWGVLTIEQGTEDHTWSQVEIDALMTAGEILGAAIHHRTLVEIYQNPVEHSLVGIFLLRDEILEYVNPRFAEIFGYTPGEITGRPFISNLIDPGDRELVETHRVNKEEGREESAHYIVNGIKKDGTRIVLELYSKTVDYQGERGIIGTIMDITKRTLAETALHESEDMFRSLAQIAPVGIFLVDSRGQYFFVNDQWCRIMDITVDEAAGSGWLSAIHPNDRAAVGEEWQSFLNKGDEFTTEQRLLHKDGTIAWILVRALARRNAEGLASGYVGTIVDITERKKYEETLKASLEEKSILIMEIHHRVKNNLQIISGLIRLQSRQITNPQALDALRECETRVITMALVHESLYQSGNLANISARRHITNLANTLLMSDERDVKVAMDVDVDDIPLDMNTAVPASLIINELVINSLKYAFTGRESGTIHIGLHKDPEGFLELTVADNGVGLPPDLDISRTTSLGLKLVTRLVQDQLKGTMNVRSDHGTAFFMRFPPGQPKSVKGA